MMVLLRYTLRNTDYRQCVDLVILPAAAKTAHTYILAACRSPLCIECEQTPAHGVIAGNTLSFFHTADSNAADPHPTPNVPVVCCSFI